MGCGASRPQDPNTIWIDHFDVHRVIGEGGFGKVNAVQRISDGEWYAMKTLVKSKILLKRNVPMVYNERDILARIPVNPWVVNLHFCFQDEINLYVVIDIAFGGDLRFRLNHSPNRKLDKEEVLFYGICCFFGLEYLHGAQVVHRDIKPDNVLIDDNGYGLITDMGVSKILNKDGFVTGRSGTGSYLAPEVFIPPEHLHNEAVDVYAMGVMMYELMVGKKPFDKVVVRQYGKLMSRVHGTEGRLSGIIPSLVSENSSSSKSDQQSSTHDDSKKQDLEKLRMTLQIDPIKIPDPDVFDLINRMLCLDYRERITIPEIFKHPALRGHDIEKIRKREVTPKFVPDKTRAYCEVNQDDVAQLLAGDDRMSRRSLKSCESFKGDPNDDAPFAKFDYNTKVPPKVGKNGKVAPDSNTKG